MTTRLLLLIALVVLAGCSQTEAITRNDPGALHEANMAIGVFGVALGVVGVAWAIAWAYVNRKHV